MAELIAPTARTRLKRLPDRGAFERETVNAILDEALVCHMGFVHDGQPFVIPTTFGRIDDGLYLHGSAASRALRTLRGDVSMCVTVTLLDGLVLARSAFHHSMNYRSVVVLGAVTEVTDVDEKTRALEAIVEHMSPGRWDAVRPPTEKEMKGTMVLRLPITEASAKIRRGGPIDDAEDMTWPCWAGYVPLRLVAFPPVSDPAVQPGHSAPDSVNPYVEAVA